MASIDLMELSRRESERVEWKDKVADFKSVVKTITAFANDFSNLGGGYVVCGAKEGKDEHGFAEVQYTGLTSAELKGLEGKVLTACREHVDPPIVPLTEELPCETPDRRVLIFIVPASEKPHSFRSGTDSGNIYYIRIGRETREARNGLFMELMVKKKAAEPWDRRPQRNATLRDIDLLTLREHLQRMKLWDEKRGLEEYLAPDFRLSSFTPPLTQRETVMEETRPRNFSLLLCSREPHLFFEGAYTVLSFYRGSDRSEPQAEKREITGNVIDQVRRIMEFLNAETVIAFDKEDIKPNQVKYPERALQEAVVNALVHRDYELRQPTRITVFIDRIEIVSPGALPRAVDGDAFRNGNASAYWRNQSLAYFFNKLQLAQGEGQGIPTIRRLMSQEGCPNPEFILGEESVTCVLPAHPRHAQLRELQRVEKQIILGEHLEAISSLEHMLERDPFNYRALELFCDAHIQNQSSRAFYTFLRDQLKYSETDLEKIRPSALLLIAETLLASEYSQDIVDFAQRALSIARGGILEEKEIKKVAINYRKLSDDQKAIEFIDEEMKKNPALQENPALLDVRGKAKIDLAKKCINTAKRRETRQEMKSKAWNEARRWLTEAEKDLMLALANVKDGTQKEFIVRDLEFLETMKEIAIKPEGKGGSRKSGHRRKSNQ